MTDDNITITITSNRTDGVRVERTIFTNEKELGKHLATLVKSNTRDVVSINFDDTNSYVLIFRGGKG